MIHHANHCSVLYVPSWYRLNAFFGKLSVKIVCCGYDSIYSETVAKFYGGVLLQRKTYISECCILCLISKYYITSIIIARIGSAGIIKIIYPRAYIICLFLFSIHSIPRILCTDAQHSASVYIYIKYGKNINLKLSDCTNLLFDTTPRTALRTFNKRRRCLLSTRSYITPATQIGRAHV